MALTLPFLGAKTKPQIVFGPPYAVINLSKVGLRYFRIFLMVSPTSKEKLLERFVRHPNIGWIFAGEGWFNLGIGIWARDNSEINDLSAAIRELLGPKDKIIYQSELTSLYGFGNRPVHSQEEAMPIIDSTHTPVDLSPLELDYLKLITLDDSLALPELARILGIEESVVTDTRAALTNKGVIVGTQQRLNYEGHYFKVVINSASRTNQDAIETLWNKLWTDPNCVYLAKGNGVYDLEFEAVLSEKSAIKEYVKDFSDYQIATMDENLYTNLYPLGKMANLLDIERAFATQQGSIIDFRTSKLWYIRRSAADAYLNIYKNRDYFEAMEKVELDLFDECADHIRKDHPGATYSLIDLGSGDGMKARIFIEKLGVENVKSYYPVDMQPVELAAAIKAQGDDAYAKIPTLLDFENLSARFPLKLSPDEHQIYMLLGGTYGNFDHKTINAHLKPLVTEASTVLVAMPIRKGDKTDAEISALYANTEIENVAFALLEQVGFKRESFAHNPQFPELYIHTQIEDGRNVCSLILQKDVNIDGRSFSAGTQFKMISSWKPTLAEFRAALELDFSIAYMVENGDMAIASITTKHE